VSRAGATPEARAPAARPTLVAAFASCPDVRILDARDAAAFALGHPAGAGRLSLAEFATHRMELPSRQTPLLVVHDAPALARLAAEDLAARGFARVSWLACSLADERSGHASTAPAARLWSPSPFVEAAAEHAPRGRALDLACGSARAAVYLALSGWRSEGWDADESALERARVFANRQQAHVTLRRVDLEAAPLADPEEPFDLIVVVRYLHRPLFAWIERALAPGGVLLYETFREGQERWGPPRRPRHLLRPGELLSAFPSLAVEHHEETPEGAPPLLSRLAARRRP